MQRWVGLAVIADNVINIGRVLFQADLAIRPTAFCAGK